MRYLLALCLLIPICLAIGCSSELKREQVELTAELLNAAVEAADKAGIDGDVVVEVESQPFEAGLQQSFYVDPPFRARAELRAQARPDVD